MATFQVTRMRKSMTVDAPWFLYWDRYFFSEAFPMLLLAGAAAASLLAARASTGRARAALLAAGVVVVAGWTIDIAPPVQRQAEQAMFEDAYDELAAIDALMPQALPVVYDGLVEHPEHWFWANSSRVLAEPLVQTFGHRILNRAGPLEPDPRPTVGQVSEMLAGAGASQGYLLQVRPDDRWRPITPSLDPQVAGEVTVPIERLEGKSAVPPEDQAWLTTTLHVRVVLVSTGPADGDGGAAASGP